MVQLFFPPEWFPQSAIQLTWVHEDTDWSYMIDEITACYINIAQEILKDQKLLVVCKDVQQVESLIGEHKNLKCVETPTNDTWARDHAGIAVFCDNKPVLYDFTFNGWGLKFASNFDNQINKELFRQGAFAKDVTFINKKDFVLEGGSIESDGKGSLLTTSECLLSPNRNSHLSKQEVENYLTTAFGLKRVLWLDHGYLAGDDTDSHIDTLARFCDEHTIAYLKCNDKDDEHFDALQKMEEQLKTFVDFEGNPYRLLPLPMTEKIEFEADRLPATYANFLILNTRVLVPTYNVAQDSQALEQLQLAFPNKKIVGINCLPIIKQHGSLHCVTMQYPEGFIS